MITRQTNELEQLLAQLEGLDADSLRALRLTIEHYGDCKTYLVVRAEKCSITRLSLNGRELAIVRNFMKQWRRRRLPPSTTWTHTFLVSADHDLERGADCRKAD